MGFLPLSRSVTQGAPDSTFWAPAVTAVVEGDDIVFGIPISIQYTLQTILCSMPFYLQSLGADVPAFVSPTKSLSTNTFQARLSIRSPV